MGLLLSLLGLDPSYINAMHTLNLSLKNGNLGYNLQRQTTYAVYIVVSFLKNNVSESAAPKDDGRDTRTLPGVFQGWRDDCSVFLWPVEKMG